MSDEKITINRPLVGIIAIVCLGAAGGLWRFQLAEMLWIAGFLRVGLVMSALWLALPSRHRQAAWANVSPTTFVGLIVAILAVARWPRVAIPVLIVVAVIGFVLRPREKRRPKSPTKPST